MDVTQNISERRKKLLALKQKLENDLLYCEREIKNIKSSKVYFQDDLSDDSDPELQEAMANRTKVRARDLDKQAQQSLACLEFLESYASLEVVKSQVVPLLEPPTINDRSLKPSKSVPGSWKQISIECELPRVPFKITYDKLQPYDSAASPIYRRLKVELAKQQQEEELEGSLLHLMREPSSAVSVLTNYSEAYETRRSTLKALIDKYHQHGASVERVPKGTFTFKLEGHLEVGWRLASRGKLGSCDHCFKMHLEYMEAQYVSIVKSNYDRLEEPDLSTEGRIQIFSKIIDTCIAANSQNHRTESSDGGREFVGARSSMLALGEEDRVLGIKQDGAKVVRATAESKEKAMSNVKDKKIGKAKGKYDADKGEQREMADITDSSQKVTQKPRKKPGKSDAVKDPIVNDVAEKPPATKIVAKKQTNKNVTEAKLPEKASKIGKSKIPLKKKDPAIELRTVPVTKTADDEKKTKIQQKTQAKAHKRPISQDLALGSKRKKLAASPRSSPRTKKAGPD